MEAVLLLLLIGVPVAAAAKGLGRRRIWFTASIVALVFAVGSHLISMRGTLSTFQDIRRQAPSPESPQHAGSERKEAPATRTVSPGKTAADIRATPLGSDSYSRLAARLFACLCLGMLFAGLFHRPEIGRTEQVVAAAGVLPSPSVPSPTRTPEELWISAREVQGIAVLDLSGRLVLGEACNTLRERWRQSLAANKTRILLNLKDVSRVDSAGIGSLVEAVIETAKQGGQLKLLNVPRLVQGVLTVHKLSSVFEVYESEEQALNSFRG